MAMSELEKELQQMEAQYGQQFGDASDAEEELDDTQDGVDAGGCKHAHIHTHTQKE